MIDILRTLSVLISLAAFIYGVLAASRNGGPMYFRIVIGVAVCHLLKEMSALVAYLCGDPVGSFTVATLATISSVFFLLSANYGQIDGIVDDGSTRARIKLISCVVPLLLLCSFAAFLAAGVLRNTMQIITDAAVVVLMLPASYFNTKHLLMPDDEVGFLKSSRGCNIGAIVYYFLLRLQTLAELTGPQVFSEGMRVAVSASVMLLVWMAERGGKRWKTLISSFL